MDAPNRACAHAIVERTYMRRPDMHDPFRALMSVTRFVRSRERNRTFPRVEVANRKIDALRKIPQSIC